MAIPHKTVIRVLPDHGGAGELRDLVDELEARDKRIADLEATLQQIRDETYLECPFCGKALI